MVGVAALAWRFVVVVFVSAAGCGLATEQVRAALVRLLFMALEPMSEMVLVIVLEQA